MNKNYTGCFLEYLILCECAKELITLATCCVSPLAASGAVSCGGIGGIGGIGAGGNVFRDIHGSHSQLSRLFRVTGGSRLNGC